MRAAKVDDNQTEIVKALRQVGATVKALHAVGDDFPDLAVGYHGRTYLIEIKDGNKPPSRRKLSPGQKEFHESWRGHAAVANNVDEALKEIGAI